MTISPCEEVQHPDVYNNTMVSEKETTNPQCLTQLSFLSFLEVPPPNEHRMRLDAYQNCKNCTVLQVESADGYSPSNVDIDIEKQAMETPRTGERTVRSSMKTESALTRALRRKISLQIGGEIIQLLMNQSIMLLKCTFTDKSTAERAPDTPNSRWRRYKRAASFDSRKIVLLFSILSSMGSMVLIYLTLRVKKIDDGLVPM